MKLHKSIIASDPTHCIRAHDMSIRPKNPNRSTTVFRSYRSWKLRCRKGLLRISFL